MSTTAPPPPETHGGTGEEFFFSHSVSAPGTVPLRREPLPKLAMFGMTAFFAGATEPAEVWPGRLLEQVTVRVVLDAALVPGAGRLSSVSVGEDDVRALHTLCRVMVPSGAAFRFGAALTPPDAEEDAADPPDDGPVSREDAADMRLAAQMAVMHAPAVAVERPQVPELSGDPVADVRVLYGLTYAQLASLLGVTERQVHRLDAERLTPERRGLLDALVAVGLILIGGLGPEGARRWLETGSPTGLELLRQGRHAELRARAGQLRDSVAT